MKISLIKTIFRRYKKIMFTLLMIAALASSLMNSLFNGWQSLNDSFNEYISEYGIADAVITTEVTDLGTAELIRGVPGVSEVMARMTGAAQILTPAGEAYTAQIISMDRDDMLRMYYWQYPEEAEGDYIFAAEWFAENIGVSAGDVIRVRVGEDEFRPFTVAAIVSVPETMERTKLNLGGNIYPDYGMLYAPISLLKTETDRESDRMKSEWKEREQEYLEAKEEVEANMAEGLSELDEARKELEKQEKEFEDRRGELKEQTRELTSVRIQLMLGRKELEDAEETAADKKEQLTRMLERSGEQLLELEDRQVELREFRNDLNSLLVQLEDAKGRLSVMRDQISGRQGELDSMLWVLREGQELWNQARDYDPGIELPEAAVEQGQKITAEVEAKLAENGITPDSLDEWIGQAEDGRSQIGNGVNQIQSGISQINREYLPEIQTYLEETEQGLELVAVIHDTLQKGIAEAEQGLKAIADFEEKAPESKEEINLRLQEVEDGLEAIYSGIEEWEKALEEGRNQLEEKSAEAEEASGEAAAELAEAEQSLSDAWDQIVGWKGYTRLRNEFLIWFDPDVREMRDRRSVLKAAEAAAETAEDVSVKDSELYEDSKVAIGINNTLEPLWKMSVLIPVLFAGIMMMVLFLFLSILIRQNRHNIGILRAMGFSRGEIWGSYNIVFLILLTISAVLGGGLSIPMTERLNEIIQSVYYLPEMKRVFNWYLFAFTVLAMDLVGFFAVAVSSRSLNRIQPAEAISRLAAAAPKMGFAARKLLRRVEPLSKYSLLSLRRNPFRFFSSVFCTGGAVCMIFATLSIIVARNECSNDIFERQLRYDAQIVFSQEPEETLEEEICGMPFVTEAERFWSGNAMISSEGKTYNGTMMFLDPGTDKISLNDSRGMPMDYPKEGINLSSDAAKALGVTEGDTVTVGETEIKVTGISRQLGMDTQYLPAGERERFRSMDLTGWLIRTEENSSSSELMSRLLREEGYVTTLWKSLMRKGFDDLNSLFIVYAWVMVAVCCVVGMFIVVNTGQNNLNEQRLSLSVLRTIGFQHRDIARRWFLQSVLFLTVSLIIGMPVGRILADFALGLLDIHNRHMEYVPSSFQYIWTVCATFAFMLAGHLITVHSMRKWNLVEETKGRE